MTHARNERPHIVLPFKASRLLRYCAGYCEVWSARQEELVRTLDGFAAFHPYRRRGLWGEAEVRYSHSPRSTVNCFLCGFRDRLLLALKRGYPEHFAAVCELKCSPREAGISAGIIKTRPFRCGGVCDSPKSLPSGPAHEPQSQSGHENGYNDTTPPEPSLSGVSDHAVHTVRRGRRSFETAQTAAVS